MLNRPSKAVVTRVVGIVGALVALSAFLVLSNVPGSVFAQDTGVITYAENGTTPRCERSPPRTRRGHGDSLGRDGYRRR